MNDVRQQPFGLALFFLLFLAACGQAPENASIIVLADGEALRKDAAEYAADQNISIDEAVERLELQDDVGQFEKTLVANESDTFGGLWIQHQPEYAVVVATTDNGNEIADYARSTPFASDVKVQTVNKSLRQLEAEQSAIISTLEILKVPSESSINVYENQVELQVRDVANLNSVLSGTGKLALLEDVAVTQVKSFMSTTANLYAGNNMSCTSGFSVRDGNGLYGISTAGHCNDSLSYGSISLRLNGQWYGSSDLQWHTHTSGSHLYKPWARDNEPTSGGTNYYREIYDNANRDTQPIGALVCKQGLTTGYTCGYINSKTVAAAAPYNSATYIRTGRDDKVVRSDRGDSGGPVYVGHQAWGLTHGGYLDDPSNPYYGQHVYMAANYITDRGLIINHAPR